MILINKLLLLIVKRLFQIWDGLNYKVFQDLHKVVLEELTFYQILKKTINVRNKSAPGPVNNYIDIDGRQYRLLPRGL